MRKSLDNQELDSAASNPAPRVEPGGEPETLRAEVENVAAILRHVGYGAAADRLESRLATAEASRARAEQEPTDDDVRRAVCDYNEWDFAEMGALVHPLDSRTRSLRRVLERFVALRAALRPEPPRSGA